jgi:hypothetical protein
MIEKTPLKTDLGIFTLYLAVFAQIGLNVLMLIWKPFQKKNKFGGFQLLLSTFCPLWSQMLSERL